MRVSFIVSGLSGTFAFIGTLFILYEVFKNYKNINALKIGELLILISIAFGIHALGHYMEEIYFNFNPLIGNWKIHNYPETL